MGQGLGLLVRLVASRLLVSVVVLLVSLVLLLVSVVVLFVSLVLLFVSAVLLLRLGVVVWAGFVADFSSFVSAGLGDARVRRTTVAGLFVSVLLVDGLRFAVIVVGDRSWLVDGVQVGLVAGLVSGALFVPAGVLSLMIVVGEFRFVSVVCWFRPVRVVCRFGFVSAVLILAGVRVTLTVAEIGVAGQVTFGASTFVADQRFESSLVLDGVVVEVFPSVASRLGVTFVIVGAVTTAKASFSVQGSVGRGSVVSSVSRSVAVA